MKAQEGFALRAEGLNVRFGGVHALQDVTFEVPRGGVHGIIGPNGAGKTTLLNALCGFVRSSGSIRLEGREIVNLASHRRFALGLGRTFQNPRTEGTLTVRDVLRLGEHLGGHQPWWMVVVAPMKADKSLAQSTRRAAELLELVGIDPAILSERIDSLPSGMMKMVDIVRALLSGPRVLLMDEPTSGMNEGEIQRLKDVLTGLHARDLTVVLVEHNLGFVNGTCGSATALESGGLLGHGPPSELMARPEVVRAYLGDGEVDALPPEEETSADHGLRVPEEQVSGHFDTRENQS